MINVIIGEKGTGKTARLIEAVHIAECMEKGLLTSPVATPQVTIEGIAALEEVKRSW